MATVPIIRTLSGLYSYLEQRRSEAQPATTTLKPSQVLGHVGLVPTMGALHGGHLSLIDRARQETRIVLVSIFVNPLQFGPQEDLERYPQTLEQDRHLCQTAGVDAIFAPASEQILPPAALGAVTMVIPPAGLLQPLCGQTRIGHFEGVATIVLKLLNLVQPDRAYFGRKDAQQLAIIQRLVADLNVPVEIVPCAIAREPSGLACSSRNQYLGAEDRQQAAVLFQSLQAAQAQFAAGICDRTVLLDTVKQACATVPSLALEYVDLVDPQHLVPLAQVDTTGLLAIAAHIGSTRLIDNILLDRRPPILAIDGPAGAGKSTVTRLCAQQLGLKYLDTGAMYRAITWLALQVNIDINDPIAVADLVSQADLHMQLDADPQHPPRIWVQQQEVTQAIRTPKVTQQVSAIAAQPAVRTALVHQQRVLGAAGGIAAEGRDIGTHVFPDAGLKIFLTASSQERARRRLQDLQQRGNHDLDLATLEQQMAHRDRLDSQRTVSPLCQAHDAIELLTDGLSIADVTAKIVHLYQERHLDHHAPTSEHSPS